MQVDSEHVLLNSFNEGISRMAKLIQKRIREIYMCLYTHTHTCIHIHTYIYNVNTHAYICIYML